MYYSDSESEDSLAAEICGLFEEFLLECGEECLSYSLVSWNNPEEEEQDPEEILNLSWDTWESGDGKTLQQHCMEIAEGIVSTFQSFLNNKASEQTVRQKINKSPGEVLFWLFSVVADQKGWIPQPRDCQRQCMAFIEKAKQTAQDLRESITELLS